MIDYDSSLIADETQRVLALDIGAIEPANTWISGRDPSAGLLVNCPYDAPSIALTFAFTPRH